MDYKQQLIAGICQALVEEDVLSHEDIHILEKAFSASSVERFEEFLLDEDVVEKADLLHALQQYYQLGSLDVVGMLFEHTLLRQFPQSTMLQYGFIPYIHDGDVLQVIASRPTDPDLLEIIGRSVSYDVVFLVGLYRDICDAVKEFYDESVAVLHDDDIQEMTDEVVDAEDEAETEAEAEAENLVEDEE